MFAGTQMMKGDPTMKMATRLLFTLSALGVLTSTAGAEPYWIAYEGNDFPENEGWTRTFSDPNGVVGQGGAVRTLDDGALVLDSRESVMIVDFYNWSRPIDPEPGETFVMQWRLLVDDVASTYPYDVTVGVYSDQFTAVYFALGESELSSVFEPELHASYEPHVFHTFELRSGTMSSYCLWIDGALSLTGKFQEVFEKSRVGWGDSIQGGRSLSHWDSFEFGVIPEPAGWCSMTFLVLFLHGHRVKGD